MKAFVCVSQWKWWMPLCSPALAIWRGKQSVTLCLLSTAALTDTGERPSLLAQRSPRYPDSLLTHLLPSDCTCAPLQHTSWHEHTLTTLWHPEHEAAAPQNSSQIFIHMRISGDAFSVTSLHAHTHTHTHPSPHCIWHLTPGNALDPQWQQAGGTAAHSLIPSHTERLQDGKKAFLYRKLKTVGEGLGHSLKVDFNYFFAYFLALCCTKPFWAARVVQDDLV